MLHKNCILRFILLILPILIFLNSCQTSAFLPQTHNVPLFTDKNQLRINTNLTHRAIDLNIAYSPSKHIGLLLNGAFTRNYIKPEIAIGAFKQYNKFVFEYYTGCSYSVVQADYYDSPSSTFYKSDYSKYHSYIKAFTVFPQINFGYKFDNTKSVAFSFKTNFWFIDNYQFKINNTRGTSGYRTKSTADSIYTSNRQQIGFEPAITYVTGNEFLKFSIQSGFYALQFNELGRINPYVNNPFFIRIGILLTINRNKK
jgi:hypothetical protein